MQQSRALRIVWFLCMAPAACDSSDQLGLNTSALLELPCDANERCPEGYACANFSDIDPNLVGGRCYPGTDPCAVVTCPDDQYCLVFHELPARVTCLH